MHLGPIMNTSRVNEQMIKAAFAGDAHALSRSLADGADPKHIDDSGMNALIFAARSGSASCVKLLIPLSDCDLTCADGFNALGHAAIGGHIEAATELLTRISAKSYDREGRTPLIVALTFKHWPLAKMLAPLSDIQATDGDGQTALLHAACRLGGSELVEMLIPLSDTQFSSERKLPILSLAALHGDERSVELLAPFFNPNETIPRSGGITPLHSSASRGHPLAIKALLAAGARPVSKNDGETPLMAAAQKGHMACIDALLPSSDAKAANRRGWTALMMPHRNGRYMVMGKPHPVHPALIAASDPLAANNEGMTALMLAVENSAYDWTLALAGCSNLAAVNKNGRHALDLAKQTELTYPKKNEARLVRDAIFSLMEATTLAGSLKPRQALKTPAAKSL